MSPADVLNQAADLIEREGWWNGQGFMPEGPEPHKRCAVMAIDDLSYHGDVTEELLDRVRLRLGCQSIADWNDRQPDGATVCAALRECARSL
jgi:hypothetical protein